MQPDKRRIGVKFTIVFPITLITALSIAILGVMMVHNIKSSNTDLVLEVAEVAAEYAVHQVDGDLIPEIVKGSENSEAYKSIQKSLAEVVSTTPIVFAYTMYTDGYAAYNGVVVGYEEKVGTVISADYNHLAPAFRGTPVVDSSFRETDLGILVNCYLPIRDSHGDVVGALGCTYDASDVYGIVNDSARLVSFSLIAIIVFLAITGTLVTRKVLSPLTIAEQLMRQVATCDLSSTDDIEIPNNEIGDIIRNAIEAKTHTEAVIKDVQSQLDAMAQGDFSEQIQDKSIYVGAYRGINSAIQTIRDTTRETLTEIRTESNQVAVGAQQISDGAQVISQGVVSQAASIEELSSAVNNVVAEVNSNAEHATNMGTLMEQNNAALTQSNEHMQNLVGSMADVAEKSGKIVDIVKSIDDIAFQTNILALNAAVEAARAGSQGKGFAVVVDEVRALAAKSAEAAKDAEEIISLSMRVIKQSMTLADETANYLKAVVSGMNEMAQSVDGVSASCSNQATEIRQINDGISQVSAIVQSNSAISEETAAASEELSAQADSLDQLVGQFNL